MDKIIDFKRFKNDGEYRTIILTVISGLFLITSWTGLLKGILPFDPALISIVISGTPILLEAGEGLITRFDLKANVLVSIALIASVAIGEYFAAAEIAVIMMIGEILEDRTVRKSQESVKKLIQLTPQTARIMSPAGEKEISIEQVKIGDIILVRPGESIPVDGIIIKGHTSINQSIITGESIPVDKTVGDEAFVGTLNHLGAIEIKARKVGGDTSLAKLIRLVKESEDKKAPVVRITDRVATVIVPLAVLASIVTYLLTRDITRLVTILVVFCPCALVLATPTAIMAGIGNASRKGILIKSGEALENAGRIDTVAFDKTGTVTNGNPEVIDIISLNNRYSKDTVLSLASAAEKFSEHPLGKSVYVKAKEMSLNVAEPQKFKIKPGKGVTALINGKNVMVGNQKMIGTTEEQSQFIKSYENQGKTVLIVAVENSVIGLITVADKIKNKSPETIQQLKEMGINKILLITGDNKNVAHSIAKQVGIKDVYAEQLPEGKVHVIENHLNDNRKVCMIGDGINDAPALAISDVSVAMGALGADVAIETADIALMSDDTSKIPELIDLSKKVMGTINVNIAAPILINITAIMLAAFGIIGPVTGALIHNIGSVLVVANSSRLIKYRTNKGSQKRKDVLNISHPLKAER
ncbi:MULTISPECIES: heavy metal translocating P-type ATPase [Methanobacterium]|jgi:heavy metal translocating P-type ATPase|uniref:Cation-translocating P-type ATPase n=1 Tax=Methanobacterium veterum TaxID=408577 RepID=A0A9E5DLY0_9EURY|nr:MULTISPECIES: cation-translocating P-type ATPase [Methanobacterium]MCZ3366711.1 cation-translocating P-type ATPase [Methanobacterium veterum]MCZ3374144.1 cation-translocating P-type ATPase [Methanobacterium veterum]